MFVLNTNVLSELMRPLPDREVVAWMAGQRLELLFTTAICQAEILAGIAILPEGARRRGLEEAALAVFTEDFEGRVLPFDAPAAIAYAALFAARRAAGLASSTPDVMIAAIARAHGASIVTRDSRGFAGCGLTVINPWARN